MVNYGLIIQKRYRKNSGGLIRRFSIFFVVIDLDRGDFPFNYICEIPKIFRDTNYGQLFPDANSGLLLAKELLESAEKEYTDSAIRKEIYSRLSLIERYLQSIQQKHEISRFY